MVDVLLSGAEGRILVANLLDGLQEGLYGEQFVKDFLASCLKAYEEKMASSGQSLDSTQLVGLFAKVARGELPDGHGRSFLLHCRAGQGLSDHGEQISTIMSWSVCSQYLLDEEKIAMIDPHLNLPKLPNPSDPALGDLVEEIGVLIEEGEAVFQASAELGGGRTPLFWIFPSTKLSQSQLGDAPRDRLGLIHHPKDRALVELQLEAAQLVDRQHARPIFTDDCEGRRFRTVPDDVDARNDRHWGRTVDLEALARNESNVDGLPEHIVECTSVSQVSPHGLRWRGWTRVTRGDDDQDNDQAFAKRLARHRSTGVMESELLNLLP